MGKYDFSNLKKMQKYRAVQYRLPPKDEMDYINSEWMSWYDRIRSGEQSEVDSVAKHIITQDDIDWYGEDISKSHDLTNNMLASMIVSLWARIDYLLKKICKLYRPSNNVVFKGKDLKNYRDEILKITDEDIDLYNIDNFNVINFIRILNNLYKHSDSIYHSSAKTHDLIEPDLANKYGLDNMVSDNKVIKGRIDFHSLKIDIIIIEAGCFLDEVHNKVHNKVGSQ